MSMMEIAIILAGVLLGLLYQYAGWRRCRETRRGELLLRLRYPDRRILLTALVTVGLVMIIVMLRLMRFSSASDWRVVAWIGGSLLLLLVLLPGAFVPQKVYREGLLVEPIFVWPRFIPWSQLRSWQRDFDYRLRLETIDGRSLALDHAEEDGPPLEALLNQHLPGR